MSLILLDESSLTDIARTIANAATSRATQRALESWLIERMEGLAGRLEQRTFRARGPRHADRCSNARGDGGAYEQAMQAAAVQFGMGEESARLAHRRFGREIRAVMLEALKGVRAADS